MIYLPRVHPFEKIDDHGSRVTDISRLKHLPLTDLELWCTDVSDISPLKGMHLKRLNIETSESARLRSFPVEGMELESLQFLANGVTKGIGIVRRMKSLKEINRMKPEEFWKEYDADAPAREMVAKAGLKFTRLDAGTDGELSLWFPWDDLTDLAPLKGLPVVFWGSANRRCPTFGRWPIAVAWPLHQERRPDRPVAVARHSARRTLSGL